MSSILICFLDCFDTQKIYLAPWRVLGCSGKTIAILPSTLSNIYPKENTHLAECIVQNSGLVLTEYITKPATRYDRIRRFIERDRLQAMVTEKILLIASHLPRQGDSGAHHAIEKAKEFSAKRFVLYDPTTDEDEPLFALNRKYIDKDAPLIIIKNYEAMITKGLIGAAPSDPFIFFRLPIRKIAVNL